MKLGQQELYCRILLLLGRHRRRRHYDALCACTTAVFAVNRICGLYILLLLMLWTKCESRHKKLIKIFIKINVILITITSSTVARIDFELN